MIALVSIQKTWDLGLSAHHKLIWVMNLNARMQALTASVGTEPGMHDMLMQAQCKYGNRQLGLIQT